MTIKWQTEFLNDAVEAEFLTLPADMQARLLKISELIEQFGLENLGMPYLRHIQGKIWEMRAKGRSGISRALYLAVTGRGCHPTGLCQKNTSNSSIGNCTRFGQDKGDR